MRFLLIAKVLFVADITRLLNKKFHDLVRKRSYRQGDSIMPGTVLTITDIQRIIKPLAEKYHISEVYIFGSYARNEATIDSDIDFLIFGGKDFKLTSVFAFAEELRMIIQKEIDVFEINEVNKDSLFYETIMKERVKVA